MFLKYLDISECWEWGKFIKRLHFGSGGFLPCLHLALLFNDIINNTFLTLCDCSSGLTQ